jgi:hypothetical protein
MRFISAASATLLAITMLALPAKAMDGVNVDTGDTVTVDDGTVFKVGDTVSMFDSDGNEFDVEVQAVTDKDTSISVDVVDPESGDGATVEFKK